ncbi:thiol-activated cytolysin family protein [uncultured Parabacteroides sp.]|uniref:thiol-activated cytolysin family protein n=1 Tax=uncultured Parabacteroides sp. TaxID=512312 RepID=UPI00258AE6DE|nr:thiol-activated cytolysin family protein [uncultured Parabacteroides sp.]
MNNLIYQICSMLFLLTVFSCQQNEEISITDEINPVPTLTKYPQQDIYITVSKSDPDAINELMIFLKQNSTFFVKDSLNGRFMIYETNEISVLPEYSNYFYPCAVFAGGTIENLRFQPLSVEVDPIDISYSLIANNVVDHIDLPSLSATTRSVGKILHNNGMTGDQIASFSYNMKQFTYYDELKLSFGVNVSVGDLFQVEGSGEKTKISTVSGLTATFVQKNFTIDMDLPKDFCVLKDNNYLSKIQGYVPVYIKSITYGRRGTIMVESKEKYEVVKSAFNIAFKAGIVGASANLSAEQKKVLNEARITALVQGAKGEDAVLVVDGAEGFNTLIKNGGVFSETAPGVPISFVCAYVSDNSPFYSRFVIEIKD